jgi:hypothetical protein
MIWGLSPPPQVVLPNDGCPDNMFSMMGAKVTREISQEKHLKFRPDDFGQVFSPH